MISRKTVVATTVAAGGLLLAGVASLSAAKRPLPPLKPIGGSARGPAVAALRKSATVPGNNDFSFRLLQRLAAKSTGRDNIFLSPFSVQQAVLLAANGAAGATQTQLLRSLRQPADMARVNRAEQTLGRLLAPLPEETDSGKSAPAYEWTLANAIWTRQEPGAAFAQRCATFYGAGAYKLTGAAPINSWVKDATHGRIPTLIDSVPPATQAVLTNAVYFKGRWQSEFEPAATQNEAPFFSPGEAKGHPVPRMNQTHSFDFYAGKNYQAIALPYRGGMSLVVMLPNRGTTAQALAAGFGATTWQQMHSGWKYTRVHVGLPRFEMNYGTSLLADLKAMGMPTEGDFSAIGQGGLQIDDVVHKTFLRVDEKGTEAAAATAVEMATSFIMEKTPPREFVVDRPFLCAIVHPETDAVLFLGLINHPVAPG